MQSANLAQQTLWVLRNARVHAEDPALRSANGFAAGAGRAPAVHRAQVGRWESGTVEVTHDLVRRYERVLALPEGQLLTAIDVFSRSHVPMRAPSAIHPREAPDVGATLALLERAFTTERMAGTHWDRLSGDLARMPQALIRGGDWEHLVRRCNLEIGVSLNLDFAQRLGAAVRFVRHPRSGEIVTQMAQDVLRDPEAQLYADVASVLRYTEHPAAAQVLLGQLREPTNNHALRAALLALTSLIAGGRLGAQVTVEATRLTLEHLRDTDRPFRVRRGAANLIRAVDLPNRDRLAAGLTVDNQRFAASIIMAGRSRGADELHELQTRVRQTLEHQLSQKDQQDPVLTSVLRAAIGDTNEERNGNALAVLMLSPQGRVVGITYAAELSQSLARGDLVAAHECMSVLSWLMQPEIVDQMTDLACGTDMTGDFVYEAATLVGNCQEVPGPACDAREERLRVRFAEVVAQSHDAAAVEPVLRGFAYALGMRGRIDCIDALAAGIASGELPAGSPAVAAKAASVLGWWQRLPAHVRPERWSGPAADHLA